MACKLVQKLMQKMSWLGWVREPGEGVHKGGAVHIASLDLGVSQAHLPQGQASMSWDVKSGNLPGHVKRGSRCRSELEGVALGSGQRE